MSARAAPDMPAKTRDATTLAWARAPFIFPMGVTMMPSYIASVKFKWFIKVPAKINIGMATMLMEFRDVPIL